MRQATVEKILDGCQQPQSNTEKLLVARLKNYKATTFNKFISIKLDWLLEHTGSMAEQVMKELDREQLRQHLIQKSISP